jgi:hypothetical protein
MNKSRWITILAAVVVLAGLGMGLAAYFSVPGTSARASTLPDAAAWMPASANFVAYVDIASLLSSPLKEQWEERKNIMTEVEEFREKTGMDPWTDFRTLSFSAGKMGNAENWGLALTGDLNPEKIIAVIEEREKVERAPYGETTLYLFESSEESENRQPKALAFPSLSTALFGSPDYVRSMLDVGTGGEASAVEGPLAEWIDVLPLSETFWCVGNATEFHRVVNEKEGAPSIPPLQSFAVSGNLGADVSMIGRARAADARIVLVAHDLFIDELRAVHGEITRIGIDRVSVMHASSLDLLGCHYHPSAAQRGTTSCGAIPERPRDMLFYVPEGVI